MALALNALRKGIASHQLQQCKLPEKSPNILVGVPTRDPKSENGRMTPDFVWCLLQLQRPTNYSINFECAWEPNASAAQNREAITERAIKSGSKYLILIDDDMTFPYNTLERFIDDLETLPDAAVVTAVIGKKRIDGAPEIFKSWDGGRYWDWEKDTIEDIWACGGACMAINLEYVRQMKKPYWIDESVNYNGVYSNFSEDLNFCRKIQEEVAGKVYLDSHIVCGHIDIKTGEIFYPKSKESKKEEIQMREAEKMRLSEQRIFIVTGVGRCGTSTVSRILQEHFHIIMGYEQNDLNYEDKEFVKLNENILMGHFSFPYYLAHLEDLIKKRSQTNMEWGLKDPKTSYTLGLFLSVIENPIIIRCTRDTDLIIESLMRNYRWDEEKARRVCQDRGTRLDNLLDNRDHLVIDFTTRKTDGEIINELNQLF